MFSAGRRSHTRGAARFDSRVAVDDGRDDAIEGSMGVVLKGSVRWAGVSMKEGQGLCTQTSRLEPGCQTVEVSVF